MPIDTQEVALAVSRGLSVVCATCERYWAAREAMVPGDRCFSVDGCGSPIAGDVFHEYRGPMTQFDRYCFVCGNKATHAVRVDNSVRVIGCCSEHIQLVKTLRPENKPAPNVVVISKDGELAITGNDPAPKATLKFRSS
jgi:hypothetical protein